MSVRTNDHQLKHWDDLGYEQRRAIIRFYQKTVKCPKCSGPFVVIGGETHFLHRKWCSIPVAIYRLVMECG